jgi:hypothetical protein
MQKNLILVLVFTIFYGSFGCTKESVEPTDNELITTIQLKFIESNNTANVVTATFRDIDGDGGKAPTQFDKILLKANTSYSMSISLLNESVLPVSNITTEVSAKKDEHLFVYTPTPANLLSINITDKDSKGLPVGLAATLTTNTANTGKLKVQLRHQPTGKTGFATIGSDDVNLDFDVEVK